MTFYIMKEVISLFVLTWVFPVKLIGEVMRGPYITIYHFVFIAI